LDCNPDSDLDALGDVLSVDTSFESSFMRTNTSKLSASGAGFASDPLIKGSAL